MKCITRGFRSWPGFADLPLTAKMAWNGCQTGYTPLPRHCKQLVALVTLIACTFVFVLMTSNSEMEIDSAKYTYLRGRLKSVGNYSIHEQSRTPITWKSLGQLLHDVTPMSYPEGFFSCRPAAIWRTLKQGHGVNRYVSCSRVFYNRVPKCGSRTVLSVFKILSVPNNFSVYALVRPQGRSYFMSLKNLIDFGMNFSHLSESFLYSQHLHYVNFTQLGIQPPVYINVIRDPVERVISHFYYNKYGSGTDVKELSHNISLDECVQSRKRCPFLPVNIVIPFFCGQPKSCRSDSSDALQRAKRTLRQSYLVVGLTENLPAFIELLEVLMPNIFSNASDVFNEIEEQMINKTQTVRKPSVSLSTVRKLKDMLAHEYDFYNFAKQRFYSLYDKMRALTVAREADWTSKRKRRSARAPFITRRRSVDTTDSRIS